MKFNKISGIYMLVNTFLPIIIIVCVSLVTSLAWYKIRSSLEFYEQSLVVVIEEAGRAKVQIEKATQSLIDKSGKITKNGKKIIQRINSASTSVGNAINGFSTAFASPFKNVPNVLGGEFIRKGMRNLGNSVAAPFRPLTNQIKAVGGDINQIQNEVAEIAAEVGNLGSMHQYLSTIETEYHNQLEHLRSFIDSFVFIFYLALVFFIVFILWVSVGYILWVRSRIMQSFKLIRSELPA